MTSTVHAVVVLRLIILLVWLILALASISSWIPSRSTSRAPLFSRTGVLLAGLIIPCLVTASVAILGATDPAVEGWNRWAGPTLKDSTDWLVAGVAGAVAVITGGTVTTAVLGLADRASRPTPRRVHRTVLRGGAWIGALERLGVLGALLAGWPEGIAVILAVKGLGRYPELRAHNPGAAERFIIGTFASIGWAIACAGVAHLLRS